MSTHIDFDEGFVTSIACEGSLIDYKKSTHIFDTEKEKLDKNCCEQCLTLRSRNEYLLDENLSLKELNKELYEIDERRQKNDIERQDYILRLLKTIKKLQLRSSRLISSDSESDSLALNDRQKAVHLSSSKRQTEDKPNEKTLLQQSYESAIKENINLQKELDELRSNFDNLIEQLSKIESERIQVLEFQAKVHKEDYECEKREKENTLNELKKMSSENEKINKICKNYEKKIQKFVQLFQNTDLLSNNELKHSSSLTKISINEEKIKTNSLPNGFRSKTNKSMDKQIKSTSHSNSDVCKSDDMIECPNCQLLFPIRFHEQLLQHFEKCQRND